MIKHYLLMILVCISPMLLRAYLEWLFGNIQVTVGVLFGMLAAPCPGLYPYHRPKGIRDGYLDE